MENRALINYKIVENTNSEQWIIFVHGAGGSSRTWKYQISTLKKHFNLLLLDLRDHGESKYTIPQPTEYSFELISSDIKNVMDNLGIEKAHFVTLSMGSVLIQDFMMRYPGRVEKTIFAGGIFKADIFLMIAANFVKLMNYILPYKIMYHLFSYLLMPKERNKKARRLYQREAQKLTQHEYSKWLDLKESFFSLLERSYEHSFSKKSLVIMGEEDYVFLPYARSYVTKHENTSLVSIENTGHICNIERPELFNFLVLNFLRKKTYQGKKLVSKTLSYTN